MTEADFVSAMEIFMRHAGKEQSDCLDELAVLKALGYERVVDVKPADVIFMGMGEHL